MPKRGFLISFIFFLEFYSPGRLWTEFGTKIFFFSFLVYLISFWQKILLGRGFIIFWIFLQFYSEFSCPDRVRMELGTIFFYSFSDYLIPFWREIMPGRGYIIFKKFLLFFSDFSCPGRVWTEFGTKIFFPLFQTISSRFG